MSRTLVQPGMQRATAARRRALVTQFVFFLLWPFGALVSSLTHFRKPWAKVIFWLFCVYFGFVFIYPDPFGIGGADSARYAAQLIELNHSPVSFEGLLDTFYAPGSRDVDIYQGLVTWLVSVVTDDPRVLFMAFAAVFGFFYARNLWLIFENINKHISPILLIFMAAFALVNPIWNINGARMWTAAQIFLYGCLRYFLKGERRGGAWAASSALVHFSFLYPVAILFAWFFLPASATVCIAFYVATSFVHEINLHVLKESLSLLPEVFQPKVASYTNEAYAHSLLRRAQELNWYVVWAPVVWRYLSYAWAAGAYLRRRRWADAMPGFYRLFLFSLVLGGAANLASLVPSGGRFLTVSDSLMFAVFVGVLGRTQVPLRLKALEWASLPFLAFGILIWIRIGFDYMGIMTVMGNPFVAPFFPEQVPLIEFIKGILKG